MTAPLTRRDLIRAAAVTAGVFAALPALSQDKKKPVPILSCETYSLRDMYRDGKLTLEATPALFKELNIPGISWNDMFFKSWDTAYLDALKSAAAAAGVKSTCLIMEGNLAQADLDKRKKQVEENIKKLKAADHMGIPVVRMNLGGTGNDLDDDNIGVQRCITAFNEMLPLAVRFNIKITIENHGGCSKTADRIIHVIDGTDPRWVGSCLDFGNWPREPKELKYKEIEKLVPYAYHTHAKSHTFDSSGEEPDIDYKRVLGMLKKAKYIGAISIEWEGADPKDPVEGVKRTRDLVRKHWKGV